MALCIPLIQIAWIQSKRGTFLLTTHIAIGTLALGASFVELISRLLFIGSSASTYWLANNFNLDNWVDIADGNVVAAQTHTDEGDMIGWRVLEVVSTVTRAMNHWIDAAEWLFLAAIFSLIYMSVYKSEVTYFSRNWARLGMGMGLLFFVNFAADVLRFHVWLSQPTFVIIMTAITRFVLMPAWLIWLGLLLPGARMNSQNQHNAGTTPTTVRKDGTRFGPEDDIDTESPSFS
jgi:hypothetical protein